VLLTRECGWYYGLSRAFLPSFSGHFFLVSLWGDCVVDFIFSFDGVRGAVASLSFFVFLS